MTLPIIGGMTSSRPGFQKDASGFCRGLLPFLERMTYADG